MVGQASRKKEIEQKLKLENLDSMTKELGIYPNAMKIDAEADELKVLEGSESIVAEYRPRLIIASYHYEHETEEIVRHLASHGFRFDVYTVPLALQRARETYVYARQLQETLQYSYE